MEGVNPVLLEFSNRLLKASKYDLTIPQSGGVRTAKEQNEIFLKGFSTLDGYNKKSYHQSGNAIDIVIAGKTVKEMYDKEKLDYVGEIGKQVWFDMSQEGLLKGLVPRWGGNWKNFNDKPHWEIR